MVIVLEHGAKLIFAIILFVGSPKDVRMRCSGGQSTKLPRYDFPIVYYLCYLQMTTFHRTEWLIFLFLAVTLICSETDSYLSLT